MPVRIDGTGSVSGLTNYTAENFTTTNLTATDATVTGDITNPSFDALELAPRNLIINGAMQVWQRSTSSGVNGYTSVDRFKYSISNGTFNNEKIDLTGGEPFTEGFRAAYRMTNTTTGTAGNAYRLIEHYIEGNDINGSGWNWASASGNMTLSFWVRSSVTQDFMCYLNTESGTTKSFPVPFSCVANTWTKVTKTIPGDVGIAVPNTNARGLAVVWAPYWGTDYTTAAGPTLDQWNNWDGGNRAQDYGNGAGTWGGTTGATFDLTGVQLTATDTPIAFQHEDYATTLRKCQRYFFTVRGDIFTKFATVYTNNSSGCYLAMALPVDLRDSPTLTFNNIALVRSGQNMSAGDINSTNFSGAHISFDFGSAYGIPNSSSDLAQLRETYGTFNLDSEL
ncbi:hypothetical protein [Synechococcus phage MA10]